MRNKTGILLLWIAAIGFSFTAFSQAMDSTAFSRSAEHITLLTDRDLYLTGENIWFTASCFYEIKGNESRSQILYVELINAGQQIFDQEKFKLSDGRTTGVFRIPDELPTGIYFIRAYTMLMRNFAPETYFTAYITIINPETGMVSADTVLQPEIFLQNDQLVANTLNPLVVKIPAGFGAQIKTVELMDTSGARVKSMKFLSNGLASCSFIPSDSTIYKVKINTNSGVIIYQKLPMPHRIGLVSFAERNGNNIHYRIIGETGESATLSLKVWSQDFALVYRLNERLGKLKQGILIPCDILSLGLNYFELRSEDGQLLNLISVFVDRGSAINIPINLSKQAYGPREMAELEIHSPSTGDLNAGMYQISVIKKGTSDYLSGILPEAFIMNPILLRDREIPIIDDSIRQQINAALLIQSHRMRDHFENHNLDVLRKMKFIPEIRGISVSGQVRDEKTGSPIPGIRLYNSVLHQDFQFHSTKTLPDGRFVFSLPHLQGSHDLFFCVETNSTHPVSILLNNDFSSRFADIIETQSGVDTSYRDLINEILENRSVSANFGTEGETSYQSVTKLPPWFGREMYSINLSDYINLASIQEVFNEIVPWVRMKKKKDLYSFTVFDDRSKVTYEDPLILLDGIRISDYNALAKLLPYRIERIDVLNRTYILGDLTIRGLISIHTKTDNFGGIKTPDNGVFVNFQTQTPSANFERIDPAKEQSIHRPLPWFRTLLYYATLDNLPADGKQISFYTSDHLSEYEVIVTGMTREGKPVYGNAGFSVSRK